MITLTAQPVAAAEGVRSSLGESPRWDDRSQTLWWTDIEGGAIYSLDADAAVVRHPVPRPVGAVMLADEGLVLATTSGFERFDPSTEQLSMMVEIEASDATRRMNDASVDPWGGVLGGTMRWDAGVGEHDGILYRWTPDGGQETVATGLGCPNGLAWPRSDLFVFIDSLSGGIELWNVDQATGSIAGVASRIDTSGFEGIPDGLTVDEHGHLWVAFWGGGVVRCFDLDGTVLAAVAVGTPFVTSAAFGGPDLSTLYITTASASEESPSAGLLYEARPGVTGRAAHRFRR